MFNEISLKELASEIAEKRVVVAEILGPSYFASGHLPTAINLPLEQFEKNAEERLGDRDAEIVVYCASVTCNNSHVAADALARMGYTRVRLFAGGKAEWKDAGLALEVTP